MKQGYKQTDIGVIPEDWEVVKFTNCATLKHGFQFREEHFSKNGIKVVKIGTLQYDGKLDFSNATFINPSDLNKFSNFLLAVGDILMALTGATLGKVSIVETNETLLQNYRVGNFFNKPICVKEYVYVLLQSEFIQKAFKKLVNEAAQPNIGKSDFDKFYVPIPSTLDEQTAIATALSDTDALIASLDKKIAKKQQIKQGAMQQLLTGKKRLSGFSGEWVEKTIGDALSIRHGRDQKQVECVNGKYPILGTGGIIGKTNTPLYSKESVLIGRKGTIDKPYYFDTPFWTVDTLFYSEINSGYDAKYLFYIFSLIDWYLYNEASGVPSLNAKVIESIKINIPKNKSEQTAIAQILTDMDNEIAQLEKERDKYKELKAGMMQVLLTGRVRLV
ncbi:MAG: hypothetical protein RIS29_1879 [Bacteroidota bacterium]